MDKCLPVLDLFHGRGGGGAPQGGASDPASPPLIIEDMSLYYYRQLAHSLQVGTGRDALKLLGGLLQESYKISSYFITCHMLYNAVMWLYGSLDWNDAGWVEIGGNWWGLCPLQPLVGPGACYRIPIHVLCDVVYPVTCGVPSCYMTVFCCDKL